MLLNPLRRWNLEERLVAFETRLMQSEELLAAFLHGQWNYSLSYRLWILWALDRVLYFGSVIHFRWEKAFVLVRKMCFC